MIVLIITAVRVKSMDSHRISGRILAENIAGPGMMRLVEQSMQAQAQKTSVTEIAVKEWKHPQAALTFDDGPDIRYTPLLLDGLMAEREQGITMDWIRQQVKVGLQNVTADQAKTMVIAYEPIWAIGTGKTATTEQAQEVCADIRKCIAEIYDDATAAEIRIQYGGSVNAATAPDLFAQADIDGGLVGGASLKPDFGKIVNYK